jgi:hypothetical protein
MENIGMNDLSIGNHVVHPAFGRGKILHIDGDAVMVYFPGHAAAVPEKRVLTFKQAQSHFLTPVAIEPHPELDKLPPWKDGVFARYKTTLTMQEAKRLFVRMFPDGLDDLKFIASEITYKREAARRFIEDVLPHLSQWVDSGDVASISNGLGHVYGRDGSAKGRLNLLFQKIDEPVYFQALADGDLATVTYGRAILDFLSTGLPKAFDALVNTLGALPRRESGVSLDTWPVATWLPFIAAPDRHMLIKPTIIQAFASAFARTVRYRSEPNAETYGDVMNFVSDLKDSLEASELNRSGRRLDMIDLQSFMWVVARYTDADVKNS